MDQIIPKKIALFINNKTVPHPEYQPVEIHQIQFIESGSVDDLFCNCLEYFSNPEQLLIDIVKKIKYGGILTIEGIEIYDVVRDILVGIIQPVDINSWLYNGRQSTVSSIQICGFFKQAGFTVLNKDVDNKHYLVRAQRNA